MSWNELNKQQFSLKLAERESEYIAVEQMRVFCGTFNLNGKSPEEDLRPWLFPNQNKVDVYAIGFEEVVDLSTTSYLLQSDWLEREQRWIKACDEVLCSDSSASKFFLNLGKKPVRYRRIVKYRMFGIMVLIYVSESIDHTMISEIFTAEVPTGIMETLGNKGSVGVSFKLNETRFCFVCSHLASDTKQLQKRNADYRSSRQRLKFEYNANQDSYDLDGHEVVFWFGDFNYRVDNISLNQTIEYIYTNEIEKLVEFDQLTIERRKGTVFADFNEGKINFRPTYKYLVGQDIYEKHYEQKKAIENQDFPHIQEHGNQNAKIKLPSWTDRILWKSTNTRVNQILYSSLNTITISDHKPVYALFDVDVKRIDEKKFNKIYDKLLKETDRKINEEMPRIAIDKFEHTFEECLFYDQKTAHFTVRNEGVTRTNVDVQFYDPDAAAGQNETDDISASIKRSSSHKMNQWFTISPQHKEKFEAAANYSLQISTNLNSSILERFNKSHKAIDDFLIVRCLNGNDIFVTLLCEYKPTIIGFSLKTLSTLNGDQAFEQVDSKELYAVHESKLESYEKNINAIWIHSLKLLSAEMERDKLDKLVANTADSNKQETSRSRSGTNSSNKSNFYTETNSVHVFESAVDNKVDLYKTLMLNLREEIVDKDEYFNNKLSAEYEFFLQHLIDRCTENLNNLDKSTTSDSARNTSIKIEDQKNMVLTLLSTRDFDKFRDENFDLELLAEVLYDLLYSLPNPLIPSRYIDLFMYLANDYRESLAIFTDYFPRSHFQLFELLIKFLQVYLKCLNSCDSGLNSIIANAMFKINLTRTENRRGSPTELDKDFRKSQTANKLVMLFIENHNMTSG